MVGRPQLTFDHVHVISSDVEASAAWYAAVLGGEVGPVGQTRGADEVPALGDVCHPTRPAAR